jgi:DNA polymerase V
MAGPAASDDLGCSGAEPFALRVLGDDMAPEFNAGEIVVVEPDGALRDGSYVLAQWQQQWLLRQLCRAGDGWTLRALNPQAADTDAPAAWSVDSLATVRGVVIQKAVPGRRRSSKFYV